MNFKEVSYEQRHHEPPDVRRTTICVLTKLWDGLAIVSRLPIAVRSFFLLQNFHIDSEARPTTCSMDERGPIFETKPQGREAYHSLPYIIKFKNERSFASSFPYPFMEWIGTNFYSPNLTS